MDIDKLLAAYEHDADDDETEKCLVDSLAAQFDRLDITKPSAIALLDAIEHGALHTVEYLLKAGVSCGYFNDWAGDTCTFVTANSHTEIRSGAADFNPLLTAAKLGRTNIVRLLLQYGSKYTRDDHIYWVALDLASLGPRTGYDPSTIHGLHIAFGQEWYVTLLDAMDNGCVNTIESILRCNTREWLLEKEYTYGNAELKILAQHGNADAVDTFLKAGYSDYHQALELASRCGHTETVEIFLKAGPEMQSINKALATACEEGHFEMARILLSSYKAQVNIASYLYYNYTPDSDVRVVSALCLAVTEGNFNVTKLLLLFDVDVRLEFFEDGIEYSVIDWLLYKKSATYYGQERFEMFARFTHLLCAAGTPICQETLQNNDVQTAIPEFVIENQKPMASLKSLCRRVIQGCVLSPDRGNQNSLLTGVPQLTLPHYPGVPLPPLLKKYLVHYNDVSNQSDAEFLCDAVSRTAELIPRAQGRPHGRYYGYSAERSEYHYQGGSLRTFLSSAIYVCPAPPLPPNNSWNRSNPQTTQQPQIPNSWSAMLAVPLAPYTQYPAHTQNPTQLHYAPLVAYPQQPSYYLPNPLHILNPTQLPNSLWLPNPLQTQNPVRLPQLAQAQMLPTHYSPQIPNPQLQLTNPLQLPHAQQATHYPQHTSGQHFLHPPNPQLISSLNNGATSDFVPHVPDN